MTILNMSLRSRDLRPGSQPEGEPDQWVRVNWPNNGLPLHRFRIASFGAVAEYWPERINAVNQERREHMLQYLLIPGGLTASIAQLMEATQRERQEWQGHFFPNGTIPDRRRGHGFIFGAGIPPVPPGAAGFVHTHPVSEQTLGPPSFQDFRVLSFTSVPLQLVAEMNGRIWAVYEHGYASLLGHIRGQQFLVLNDPSASYVYAIISGDGVRTRRHEELDLQARNRARSFYEQQMAIVHARHEDMVRRRQSVRRSYFYRPPTRLIDDPNLTRDLVPPRGSSNEQPVPVIIQTGRPRR